MHRVFVRRRNPSYKVRTICEQFHASGAHQDLVIKLRFIVFRASEGCPCPLADTNAGLLRSANHEFGSWKREATPVRARMYKMKSSRTIVPPCLRFLRIFHAPGRTASAIVSRLLPDESRRRYPSVTPFRCVNPSRCINAERTSRTIGFRISFNTFVRYS